MSDFYVPDEPERVIEMGVQVNGLDAFLGVEGETLIAIACDDGRVAVNSVGRSVQLPGWSRSALAVKATSGLVVSSDGWEARVVSWPELAPVATIEEWIPRTGAIEFMPDGSRTHLIVGHGNTISLTDISWSSGEFLRLDGPDTVLSLAVDKKSGRFAAGYANGTIHVYSLLDGAPVVLGQGTPASLMACVVLPDGTRMLASALNNEILLWNLDSQQQVGSLAGHTMAISALHTMELASGRQLLVSGSEGGTVRVWDPFERTELLQLVPESITYALTSFTERDGSPRLVTAGVNGVVEIWNPRFSPRSRAGSVLTRGFGDRVASEDLLDRGAFVSALTEALEPTAREDDEIGPTVITVEGPWGSGKSTLLDLVRRQLEKPQQVTEKERRLTVAAADRVLRGGALRARPIVSRQAVPLVVSFNPWRHQSSEQVWAGLAKAVTKAAEDATLPDQDSRERYWFGRNATRIDRRHTQRELWKRIRSPLLAVSVLGLGLSVLAQLVKLPIPWPWLVAIPGTPLIAGLLHTAKRYFWDRAASFLPGELFAGPVLSNAFATGSAGTDPAVRDPYYNAKSGYLYLVQHDVAELLRDLDSRGYQLVVLVDDLDRCTPRTTAEVFEAINVFLSDALPRTRFVLGLDPVVVASHVDHAYRELADAKVVAHADDPGPGWTFLRKLVQLPVRLPPTTSGNVERVLLAHLGPVYRDEAPVPSKPVEETTETVRELPRTATESPVAEPRVSVPRQDEVAAVVIAIERHPRVREYLYRRLTAQPEHSVREEKRLINVWQFYLRVLAVSTPAHEEALVERACQLVVIAEIVTRWPAYQHLLRRGWDTLADAVDDDIEWTRATAKLGFTQADKHATVNLRAVLRDCDTQAVAGLANRLL